MELQGYDLRYLLTSMIVDAGGSATTTDLRQWAEAEGFELGPDPRRRLYGALRSEIAKGRLRRAGDGVYAIDRLPKSTRSHIRRRVAAIRAAHESGAPHPPPPHRYVARPADPGPALPSWMVRPLREGAA